MYHIGKNHVGIQSAEAPYVPAKTGQSYVQAGLSHVGTFLTQVFSDGFTATGKLQTYHKAILLCQSVLTILVKHYSGAVGYIYRPDLQQVFAIKGSLGVRFRAVIKAVAVMSQSHAGIFAINAFKIWGAQQRIKVISICQANYSNLFAAISVLQQSAKYKLQIIGLLLANYSAICKIHGVLQALYSGRFTATGMKAWGHAATFALMGAVRQQLNQVMQIQGDLANTIGHWYLVVTAKLNIAAFVQSVPKRVQEFITNKRWFKE